MFVDPEGSDSEEIIKVPEENNEGNNGPNEESHDIVKSDRGNESFGDFSVESDLGIDMEGIFVPQKGINMPTSDNNLANPSKMKLNDLENKPEPAADNRSDFSVDENLGEDIEGIYIPQKGITQPATDVYKDNPGAMKLKDLQPKSAKEDKVL